MKSMMNDDGLLECAHCGEVEGVVIGERHFGGCTICHYVVCTTCGIGTSDIIGMHRAIKRWNTRNGHLYTDDDYRQDAMEREHGL